VHSRLQNKTSVDPTRVFGPTTRSSIRKRVSPGSESLNPHTQPRLLLRAGQHILYYIVDIILLAKLYPFLMHSFYIVFMLFHHPRSFLEKRVERLKKGLIRLRRTSIARFYASITLNCANTDCHVIVDSLQYHLYNSTKLYALASAC
jgi:hypothetical protein